MYQTKPRRWAQRIACRTPEHGEKDENIDKVMQILLELLTKFSLYDTKKNTKSIKSFNNNI